MRYNARLILRGLRYGGHNYAFELVRRGRPAPRIKDTLRSIVCWVRGCDFSRGGQFCAHCGRFLP